MPKLKPGTVIPTPEEDAVINAGIAADPDTFELSESDVSKLRPVRPRGRPPLPETKIAIKLRLDREIVERFRATGPGWQSRINQALAEYAQNLPGANSGSV